METTTMALPLRCELSRWDDSLLSETRIGRAMLIELLTSTDLHYTKAYSRLSLGLRGSTMPLLQLRGKFSNPHLPSWLQSSIT